MLDKGGDIHALGQLQHAAFEPLDDFAEKSQRDEFCQSERGYVGST
jgi:hypothetical protein